MNGKRVTLRKIQELEDAVVPNNKSVGYERMGVMIEEPKVGAPFILLGPGLRGFRTSTVQEVIDQNTFRTHNSIYQIIR